MKCYLTSDDDLQDYVVVALSTARLAIFDLRSVEFVTYCIKQLVYSVSKDIASLLTYRLLFNVSSYNRIIVSLTDLNGDVLSSADFSSLVFSYNRTIASSIYQAFEKNDLVVLLSYFMTEKQKSLCGL